MPLPGRDLKIIVKGRVEGAVLPLDLEDVPPNAPATQLPSAIARSTLTPIIRRKEAPLQCLLNPGVPHLKSTIEDH